MLAIDRRLLFRFAGVFTLALMLLPTAADAQERAKRKLITLNELRNGGWSPLGRLLPHTDGHIYGVTSRSGDRRTGTAFKLTPVPGKTRWKYAKIYAFKEGSEPLGPAGGLVAGADGVLYGGQVVRGGS